VRYGHDTFVAQLNKLAIGFNQIRLIAEIVIVSIINQTHWGVAFRATDLPDAYQRCHLCWRTVDDVIKILGATWLVD
jgi:hypothetical protein